MSKMTESRKQQKPQKVTSEWADLAESKNELEGKLYKRNNVQADNWYELSTSLKDMEAKRQAQYKELENQRSKIVPTATGNIDALNAKYFKSLSDYGDYWGDQAAYDEGFQKYQEAMSRLSGQYESHIKKHLESDKAADAQLPKTFTTETAQKRIDDINNRYFRDNSLYSKMARDAETVQDEGLRQKAMQGAQMAEENYNNAYLSANQAYLSAYEKESPAEFYYQTMTQKELEAELQKLKESETTTPFQLMPKEQWEAELQKYKNGELTPYYQIVSAPQFEDELQSYNDDALNNLTKKAAIEQALKWKTAEARRAKYEEIKAAFMHQGDELLPAYSSANQSLAQKGKSMYDEDERKIIVGGEEYIDLGAPYESGIAKTYAERGPEDGYLEEWQKEIFYALYARDKEIAQEWMDLAQEQSENEHFNEIENRFSKGLAFIPGLPAAAALSLAGGISPYSERGQKLSKTAEAITAGGARALTEFSGTIDEDVPILGGKGLGDLYQLAVSMVQSGALAVASAYAGRYDAALGAVVGFLGTALMGGSAAASDYRESLARGMTKEQAMRHATAAGIAEAAFEHISLDKLVNMDISKGFWKNVFTQGGIEASEELCTTIANRISDGLLSRAEGYDTQIEHRIKELVALGENWKDAEEKAAQEWMTDLINDGLGGFISGGMMSAGSTFAQWDAYKSTMEQFGSGVSAAERAALQAYAADNGIDIAKMAQASEITESTDYSATLRASQNDNGAEGLQIADATEQTDEQHVSDAENQNVSGKNKKSTRETRSEKKTNRKQGETLTRVVDSIEQKVLDAGLENAERVYNSMVARYGENISRAAEAAVVRVAAREFSAAYETSNEAAENAYKAAMQATKAKPVQKAIQEAWKGASLEAAMLGNNKALQAVIAGSGTGGTLNLNAELATKDGGTQQVQIAALGAEKGKVRLNNGEVVELDALQGLDADTKDVIQRLDAFDLGAARSLAFQEYRLAAEKGEVTDGVRWVMNYALAYDQGRTGAISLQEAIRRSSLPAETVKSAYTQGQEATEKWRQDKENENAKKRENAKEGATGRKGILDSSRVSQEKMDRLSADKQDAIRTMELLAEATGVDIRLIAQKSDQKGNVKGYQGLYNKEGNYIEIDINAGLNNIFEDLHTGMTAVLGHELTHWMQENAPTEYLAYKKAVLQAIMSTKNGELRLERMIEAQINQNKREGKEITRSEAEDEVVADASMKRMGDTEFWDAVADNLGEKKADVAARIRDYISKFFQRVRELLRKASHTSEAARIVDQAEADVQANLRKLYAALTGAAMRNSAQTGTETKNAATEGGDVQYSVRRTKDMTLKEQLRSYYKHDGSFKSSDAFYFGESPVILGEAGIRPGSLAMTIKDFQKSTDKKHNVPRRVLNNLYSNLQNPVFSFDANGEAGVLIDDIDGDGKPVLVAIHTNETMDREHINLITSIYGLEHPKEWLKNQIDAKKKLTVFDKEKSERFFQSYGYEASEGNTIRPVEERIAQEAPSVKPSDEILSTRSDADYLDAVERGDMETAQKLVDEAAKAAGYDIKAYHGTPNGTFTVFRDWQYFTENKEYADVYQNQGASSYGYKKTARNPKTYEVYIKPQNAFDTRTARDRAIFENEFYRKWGNGAPLSDRGLPDWTDGYDLVEFFEENGYDYDAIYLDEGGTGGYGDAVNDRGISIVVKDSAQIKSADPVTYDDSGKVIPLSERFNPENKDIRYATRDYSDFSDLDLLLNAANEIVEGGGEDYWTSLLESNPGLASEAEEIKRLGKQLRDTEAKLAEARRNLTLTDRKLRTRGISTLAATIMQDQKAGDINKKDVKNRITAALTEAYQKALDQLDAGADIGTAWDTVYNEGVVKAADILLTDATYAEKLGYKWYKNTLGAYLGEGAREYVEADIASRVAQDFDANRYRPGQNGTVADRLVAQAENRATKKLDAAKTENAALKSENAKLTEAKDFYKEQAETAKATAGELYQQLLDKREELKNNKKISADERKTTLKKLDNLERQMKAKRREAEVWKSKAETGWKAANQAIRERDAAVDKLEKQLQRERDILSGKLKPPAIQSMLKAAREREAARVTQHKDEVFARYKERKSETALRGRIKNLHDEMNRDLLKPREWHFVPQGLIRPVVDLLDMVNTQTKQAKSESAQAKIDAINAAYDRIKNDERYSQYYDETVKEMLTELSATLEGRSIYDLSYAELEDVYTVMKAMRTTIRNSIKADLIEKGKEVWEIGNALRQELRAGKGASPLLLEKYHMLMLSAERAFHRFGGYMPDSAWDKTYRMLDNAQLKMMTLEMQATRLFDSVLLDKADFNQAEALTSYDKKDLVDVGLKDENGKAVPITRGMMLSLYMHLQNEENMRHLMYGGLTLPDFRRYYKGKQDAWGSGSVSIPALGARVSNLNELLETVGEDGVAAQYEAEQQAMREMWESVRGAIEEKLNPYDRKWIAASKDFFDDFSRRELNRVTNEMYGFSKAKVDNYFPIVTDQNFLKTEFDSISRDISLENAGFMKERVKAGNPILLEDITKAVNRQISNVARYAGLTQALKTFNNVYNVQTKGYTDSVKKAMAQTFGDTGKDYIKNLITDMIGGRTQPGTIFDRIKNNSAQAVLSVNIPVAIKQAASLPTAAATVGWSPIAKALAKGGKKGRVISKADRAIIDKYSPLLWKRAQGSVDVEIGDIAKGRTWAQKTPALMGWITGIDKATVGRLWYAAEYYVKDNFDLPKGTEAQIKAGESPFYQKVAEVFNHIVEDTQPNYTVLQRPDILRNPNKLVRAMTMFSTQRFQNANILLDAAGEYNAMRRFNKQSNTAESKAALKSSKQKLTRAISSQVVSAVVLNVMTLAAAAILHRMNPWRDDDDELTVESVLEETLNGFLSTMAGSFLAGSELYEMVSSMLTGSKYYGNDVGGISTINDFATAVVQFGQQAVKLIGDEDSKPEDWTKLAEKQLTKVGQYLAQMTGIPVANVNKIIAGGKNHIIDAVNGEFGSFETGVERSNAVNARRYYKAWIAEDEAKMDTVLDELVKNTKGDEDKIRNAVNKVFKNAYDAGEIDLDKYTDFIQNSGMFSDEQEKDKVRDLAKEALISGELTDSEAIGYLTESGLYDEDEAWKKVQEWKAKSAHADDEDYSYSQYDEIDAAIDANKDIKNLFSNLTEHGVKAESVKNHVKQHLVENYVSGNVSETALRNHLSRYCGIVAKTDVDKIVNDANFRKSTGYAYSDLDEAYRAGEVSKATMKSALIKYGGKTSAEADKKLRWWDLQVSKPNLDISESIANTWYDGTAKSRENGHKSAKAAGMSIEAYLRASEVLDKIKDSNGNNTGEDEVIAALAKMNLTPQQKDALYYERYKGTTKYSRKKW